MLSKKQSNKLPPVQFLGIVTGVVLVITLTGVAIARRNNSPSEETTLANKQERGNVKVETLPPPLALSSEAVQISPTTGSSSAVQVEQDNLQLAYNVPSSQNFNESKKLQAIVNELVQTAADKKLPTKPLSITLINTKTSEYGAYQQEKLRFPASVVKTFWLVYFYEKVQKGLLNEASFVTYINKMIKESDNNSASVIVDAITETQSGSDLTGEEYENWLNQRKQVNKYFQRAGYENINVNQKTFPITNIKLFEPKGADLKMRGNPEKPIRNKLSAKQTARLLYEIYSNQAVSVEQSQRMANLLTIDPQTRLTKKDDQDTEHFNPVRGFLSESLPSNIYFGAKAGWTSFTRNEAAYIATPDGKVGYILVVFGEDKAYAYDWKIFPKMSKMVYEKMTKATAK